MRFPFLVLQGVAACVATVALKAQSPDPAKSPVIGRWDMTIEADGRRSPSWLEVTLSGNRTLVGRFVHSGGSARPVAKVELRGDSLFFSLPPQWDRGNRDLAFAGRLDGVDMMTGTLVNAEGGRQTWRAVRAPALRRAAMPAWGTPIRLFDGKSLEGWTAVGGTNQWKADGGVLVNGRGGANLVTTGRWEDFKLHVEFRYPKGGNSGVYLRGRYEVQVEDSHGEPTPIGLGSIYGFLVPNQDVAKGPGEWQTFDITLVGRLVTVELNGKRIIVEQPIPGITGGALDSDEGAPGPIYLQGDHGPVEYRNLILTPAKR